MPMNAVDFEKLVADLESFAKLKPFQYKLRVAALALLAYVFIAMTIAFVAGLIYCCLTLIAVATNIPLFFQIGGLHSGIILLYFVLFGVCKSFFVRFRPPKGVLVSASDSPKIFELVNDLREQLECPKIDGVYLNADFNASVYSLPEMGFLPNHKHYLCVGLPLMQSLSPEHFRAVVAHELGHLSGNHGKFASWIYSVRSNTAQILELVRKRSAIGGFLLKHFFEWYYPYFNAYSMVLVRQHEYEADKCAAEIAGAKEAALSLINCEIKNRYIDIRYWKELFKRVDDTPIPPVTPFHDLSEVMSNSDMDPDAFRWYQEALLKSTGAEQTHPSLKDRIAAISTLEDACFESDFTEDDLRLAWGLKRSAAEEFLQSNLPDYEKRMDLAWHKAYDANWRFLYDERVEGKEQLQRYETTMMKRELTEDELLHRAQLFVQLRPARESIVILQETLKIMPDNVQLNYNLGERLLANGELSGIQLLEKVIEMRPIYGLELSEMIYQHLLDLGESKKAQAYFEKLMIYKTDLHVAARERAGLKSTDSFIAHAMAVRDLRAIVKAVEKVPEISCVYLVCKQVKTMTERPFYIVVLDIRFQWFRLMDHDEKRAIVRSISKAVALPSEGYVIDLARAPRSLKKSLHSIPNAVIYKRGQSS